MLITHDLGVVAEMVDEVMVMYAGRVVEHGSVDDVLLEPRHPYTEGLLTSIPSRGMRGQRLSVIRGTVPNPFNMPAGCNFAPRCPYRFEPCTIHDPRLGVVDGRSVACWRWLEPPAVEPAPVAADGQPLPDATPPSGTGHPRARPRAARLSIDEPRGTRCRSIPKTRDRGSGVSTDVTGGSTSPIEGTSGPADSPRPGAGSAKDRSSRSATS